jgi:hypothetical protein
MIACPSAMAIIGTQLSFACGIGIGIVPKPVLVALMSDPS